MTFPPRPRLVRNRSRSLFFGLLLPVAVIAAGCEGGSGGGSGSVDIGKSKEAASAQGSAASKAAAARGGDIQGTNKRGR